MENERLVFLKDKTSKLTAEEIMITQPISIEENKQLSEALNIMEEEKITSLVVKNKNEKIIGILYINNILK